MDSLKLLLLFIALNSTARADIIKTATLDVVCSGEKDKRVVRIISSDKSVKIIDGGIEFIKTHVLEAMTEGGDPYLQTSGDDRGIDLYGGDFQEAFNNSSEIVDGISNALISEYSSNKRYKLTCRGKFSFLNEE